MKTKKTKKATPYELGIKDGFEQGSHFDSGLTWNDPKKNEEYDKGVNEGQRQRGKI